MSSNIKTDVLNIIRSIKPKALYIFANYPYGAVESVYDVNNAKINELMRINMWLEYAEGIDAVRWNADESILHLEIRLREINVEELKLV